MSSSYNGMRWLKCDLHMHTPADTRHWKGDSSASVEEAAKKFAEVCHKKGLVLQTIISSAKILYLTYRLRLMILSGNISIGLHCFLDLSSRQISAKEYMSFVFLNREQ